MLLLHAFDDFLGADFPLLVPRAANGANPTILGFNNLAAPADPGPTNDVTQGYSIGSVWWNSTSKRMWVCYGNAAPAAGGFQISANIFKYGANGANGSNTQIAFHESVQSGSVVTALQAPSLLTLTENAPIIFAITGNAVTATTDIVWNFTDVNAMN